LTQLFDKWLKYFSDQNVTAKIMTEMSQQKKTKRGAMTVTFDLFTNSTACFFATVTTATNCVGLVSACWHIFLWTTPIYWKCWLCVRTWLWNCGSNENHCSRNTLLLKTSPACYS